MNRNSLLKTSYIAILFLTCFVLYNLSAQTTDSAEMDEAGQQYHYIILTRALNLQLTADSLNRSARLKRAELRNIIPAEEKKKLMAEISRLENKSKIVQNEADELFRMLRSVTPAGKPESKTDSSSPVELKEEINGIKVYQYKTGNLPALQEVDILEPASLHTDEQSGIKDKFNDKQEADTMTVRYGTLNPIPERVPVPGKLVYYIQLGVFSKKIPDDTFGKLPNVCYDYIKDKELYKYYTGIFFSLKSANKALAELKTAGYPESFIVPFNNGEQISTEKARQIEYAQIKF